MLDGPLSALLRRASSGGLCVGSKLLVRTYRMLSILWNVCELSLGGNSNASA